jgi:zinc transport system ATP-binding protein
MTDPVTPGSSEIIPAVQYQNLHFGYGNRSILKKVNITVPVGDFACVVGPNGSGKTTLLKLALGLLEPDTGTVKVLGKSTSRASQKIGYVPQNPTLDPLFPISVLDVALMGRLGRSSVLGLWKNKDKRIALDALAEVGMEDQQDRHFATLSGGQKQRVLIARALASDPELLLLDEPTSGLDAHVEEGFYRLLENLNKRLTIVMVSHDLGFVSGFVKSVICVGNEVIIHPTSAITGQVIADLYGTDMRLVRHDHRCSEEGHQCR